MTDDTGAHDRTPSDLAAAFVPADQTCAFGPSFFRHHLGRFVRDHCPDPSEQLPLVFLRLADGATLDVCHIVGIAPRWVMLAVHDPAGPRDRMAIEFVPYELVRRVEIGARRVDTTSIGFSQMHPPEILAPEALVRSAMPQPEATDSAAARRDAGAPPARSQF